KGSILFQGAEGNKGCIGIFLIACQMMSTNLESASSSKLKNLFAKASKSKLLGVGIGALGTAAIQSSGATTVMVIGFVNAGIISLAQAATMIYGANIGTTITAQIVALGMFGESVLSTTIIFSAFAGIGAFVMLFAKSDFWKRIGGIFTGFGMLFVGLSLMSSSMSAFAEMEAVKTFLAGISNPILLVLIGAIFTAIIQSSSVMTSIALAMVVTGLVTLDQGIFLTIGSNVGSCVVAIIAGVTSGRNAQRTALIHLIFNVSGAVLFLVAAFVMGLVSDNVTFGNIFNRMFPDVPQMQLAMFHTIFNVVTVIIVLPLTNALVKLVCKMIPDKVDADTDSPRLFFVDDNMLKTPPVAVQQTKREIVNMAQIAIENFNRSLDIVTKLDFSEKETFVKNENQLNFLNTAIIDYVVKLSKMRQLSEKDHNYLTTTFRSVRDLERIGDYAENIVEYAGMLKETGEKFSSQAVEEIDNVRTLINELYDKIMKAYTDEDFDAFAEADKIEDKIDEYTKYMETSHIARLSLGLCSPNAGAEYLSLSSNAERVADHLINVGKTIRRLV
ncbi:MAG: Na/Pi cotransporter family protein, partial [Bacteroidales bacterium]|nr:Na/Pi cotransporter family protein [Bacteroidales bacterium]